MPSGAEARVLLLLCGCVAAASPPHIVLILADDLGFADVGYSSDDILSPTIDRLAQEGVKLGAHYTWSWCAPSRGALLTGRYPVWNGYGGGGSSCGGCDNGTPTVLPSNWTLLPELLASSKAGYQSHAAGKW